MNHPPGRGDWIFWAIVGGPAAALFVFSAIANVKLVWMTYVRKVEAPSMVPLVGGIAGAIAVVLFPLRPVAHYAWLPLFLDIGCAPYLIFFNAREIKYKWSHNRFTAAGRFSAHFPGLSRARLVLYRDGTYTIEWKSLGRDERGEDGKVVPRTLGLCGGGEWTREDDTLLFGVGEVEVTYALQTDRNNERRPVTRLIWISGQTWGLPEGVEYSMAGTGIFRDS